MHSVRSYGDCNWNAADKTMIVVNMLTMVCGLDEHFHLSSKLDYNQLRYYNTFPVYFTIATE